MYWKDKATLEGDYILKGDKGMKGKWRKTLRDVAGSGRPRHCGWRGGCQNTAGHGVKKSWMGRLLYSGGYTRVLIG